MLQVQDLGNCFPIYLAHQTPDQVLLSHRCSSDTFPRGLPFLLYIFIFMFLLFICLFVYLFIYSCYSVTVVPLFREAFLNHLLYKSIESYSSNLLCPLSQTLLFSTVVINACCSMFIICVLLISLPPISAPWGQGFHLGYVLLYAQSPEKYWC